MRPRDMLRLVSGGEPPSFFRPNSGEFGAEPVLEKRETVGVFVVYSCGLAISTHGVCVGMLWPLTLIFNRGTQPFLKIDRGHEAY